MVLSADQRQMSGIIGNETSETARLDRSTVVVFILPFY